MNLNTSQMLWTMDAMDSDLVNNDKLIVICA